MSPYADFLGIPFLHPTLASVQGFLDELIEHFGDWFQHEHVKKALAACQQRGLSVAEYNTQFSHLCYQVDLTEDARIEKYQRGLNFKIVKQAMSISVEYMQTKSLAEKM